MHLKIENLGKNDFHSEESWMKAEQWMKIDVLALKFSGFLINWREQAQISRRLSSEGARDGRGARVIVRVLGKLDAS